MALQTNIMRRMMLSSSRNGSQRWRFMSTTLKPSSLEVPEDEKLIHPSLKNFVNRTAIAMQMPDMRRKYAISDAPLIPSYFLGKLQLELLEYPEMSTREEVTQALSLFSTVEEYMLNRVNSKQIDEQGALPSDVLNDCKTMGLFGQRVDQKYGGLGMSALESILIGEAMGYDPSLFATITMHEALAMKGLQLVGTEAQKEMYLPPLASGEKIASFCLAEASSGSSPTQIKTRAVLSADGTHYILNGRKSWVVNGSRADVFTVFALTSIPNDKGEEEDKVSAFLVERGFEGTIELQPTLKVTGLRGLDLVDITFKDVKIPIVNLLGELGSGAELSGRIACMDRHLVGGLCIGMCRDVLDAMTEHCTSCQQMGKPLSDFGIVQHRLSQAAAQLYAMESVTYLVAGLLTAQPDRDLKIESSAVKLFTTETTIALLNSSVNLAGAMGFTKVLPLERYLRDARVLTSFLGVNDMLRIYIGSAGLSIAGKEIRQFVEYARKPSNHIFYMLRETMRKDWRLMRLRRGRGSPAVVSSAQKETERGVRVSTRLSDHLHPNLRPVANRLSRIIIHTHEIARQIFILHGNNPNKDHLSLCLLSDLAVGLLTVTAVISRASRAKSIGVRYYNNELELAELYALETMDNLEAKLSSFKQKTNLTKRIASVMVKENGYASASPLTRVW